MHAWDVRVWPKTETVAQAQFRLPAVSLIVGLFVAGLLAVVVYSAQTSQLRAREVIAANEKLRKAIAERQEMEEQLRQAQKMEAIGRLAGYQAQAASDRPFVTGSTRRNMIRDAHAIAYATGIRTRLTQESRCSLAVHC